MVRRLRVDLGLPRLPEGVWYKGGVARAALLKAVRGVEIPIRDIDLVVFEEADPEEARRTVGELEDMGYRVDVERSTESPEDWIYYEPDLDINSCLYNGEELVCEEEAIDAARTLRIRPKEAAGSGACPYRSRILTRCLRIAADLGGVCEIPDKRELSDCLILNRRIAPFDLWLQGRRAEEGGSEDRFFAVLRELRLNLADSFREHQEELIRIYDLDVY